MADREYTFPEEVTLVDTNPDTGEEIRSMSYAEIRSVYESENYKAMAVGLKPEFKAILPYWDDYHGEQRLEWNGTPYRVIRSFKSDDGMAELTVTRLKGHVSDLDTGGIV